MPSSFMNFCRVLDLKKYVKLKFASEISIRKMNHKKPTLVKWRQSMVYQCHNQIPVWYICSYAVRNSKKSNKFTPWLIIKKAIFRDPFKIAGNLGKKQNTKFKLDYFTSVS